MSKDLLPFWYEPLDRKINSNHACNTKYNRAAQASKQVTEYLGKWQVFKTVNGMDFNQHF